MAKPDGYKDYDFDLQRQEAEVAEGKLRRILTDLVGKIELKTERGQWHDTGNIAVEYESYGKPSGIAATKADYWVHELRSQEDETLVYLMFPTPILKKICNELMDEEKWRRGGQNNMQEMVLVKLQELFSMLQHFSGSGDDKFLTRNERSNPEAEKQEAAE